MTRRRLSPEESKRIILDSAKELFINNGYNKTTTVDLCKTTNMSKGNIYHHFKNKEEIFLHVLKEYVQEIESKWKDAYDENMTPRDKFLKIAKLYGEDFESPLLDAAMEYSKQYKDSPETLAMINEIMLIVANEVKKISEEAVAIGDTKNVDADSLAFSVMAILIGVSQLCISTQEMDKIQAIDMYLTTMNNLFSGVFV
ncbi:TetR/AcrR family transcriptional regulator [Clostridium intestinale]|uniref:Transcriptional regulator, TetR family n=1 Tax=Clostridium intestinale DSM 6191 TaxID=1121320 RepID=A0A1M5YLL4_9CLOT|nr:TetR/AcrR family transcriptional regulator [Clostridium intestinale]SHI12734.1 transcriptional regulator, TetR family [Clostridium intestinale DSM 6191]